MKNMMFGLVLGAAAIAVAMFLFIGRSSLPATQQVGEQMHASVGGAYADGPAEPAQRSQVSGPAAGSSGAENPVKPDSRNLVDSVQLAPEFDALFQENPPLDQLHRTLESEPRDPQWASRMEDKWSEAFAGNQELLGYGMPTVHCRATQCEVELLTHAASTLDSQAWGRLLVSGVGNRDPADQSPPAVTGLKSAAVGSREKEGATTVVYYVAYERGDPPGG